MKAIILILFYCFINFVSYSQADSASQNKGYKLNNYFELSLGALKDQFSGALSWVHYHGIGKKKKLQIGYGLRFTAYFGKNQNYITAPSKVISGQSGPKGWFPKLKDYPYNLDTLLISNAQCYSFNISSNFQYAFTSKLNLGFNIDAIGFSFGPKQTDKFISSLNPLGTAEKQSAYVTPFNLLLVSSNDIGTLNSEFYLSYFITKKIVVKAGFIVLFTEYTTDNKLTFNNKRFRNKTEYMALLGVSYCPW